MKHRHPLQNIHPKTTKLTLEQYMRSHNLKKQITRRSRSKDTKEIPIKIASAITKITTEGLLAEITLILRELIVKDTDFVKVIRMLDKLVAQFKIEINDAQMDNNVLETIIKENSIISHVSHISKSLIGTQHQENRMDEIPVLKRNTMKEDKNKDSIRRSHIIETNKIAQETKPLPFFNLTLDQENNQYCNRNRNRVGSEKIVPSMVDPQTNQITINILEMTRHKAQKEETDKEKDTLEMVFNEVIVKSSSRRSLSFADQNQELAIQSKVEQSASKFYEIETPLTLKNTSKQQSMAQGYKELEALNRYEEFRKRRESKELFKPK